MPIAPVVESTPLERARAIATSLCLSKGLPVPVVVTLPASLTSVPSVAASIGADGKIDSRAAMLRAKAIASQLASGGKLGEGPEVKEAAAHFSEELDINDYPPQVRYIICHSIIITPSFPFPSLPLYRLPTTCDVTLYSDPFLLSLSTSYYMYWPQPPSQALISVLFFVTSSTSLCYYLSSQPLRGVAFLKHYSLLYFSFLHPPCSAFLCISPGEEEGHSQECTG